MSEKTYTPIIEREAPEENFNPNRLSVPGKFFDEYNLDDDLESEEDDFQKIRGKNKDNREPNDKPGERSDEIEEEYEKEELLPETR